MTPRLADRHDVRDYLADAAAHLLRQREASYPALVQRGTLVADDAKRKIALACIVVDQWRWVVDPARPPLPDWNERTHYFGAHDHELAAELATAAARARALADRAPDYRDAAELADLYEALAWWQQRHGQCDALIVHDVAAERRPVASTEVREAA